MFIFGLGLAFDKSRCALASVVSGKTFSLLRSRGAAAALALLLIGSGTARPSTPPAVVITSGAPEIFIDGDCNDPAIWVDGKLRMYGSPYPQSGSMGGVANYRYGPSLGQLDAVSSVTPDRSLLGSHTPPAFGPWFESILVDDAGVLWAYYHAEFPDAAHDNKVHPRIGAQVSRDQGVTWQDLGVLIDTPAGTDEYHSWLGGNFSGGNGDFSVILDAAKNYVYFFYSQYGYTDDAQGLAVARLPWNARGAPVGQAKKWDKGAWQSAGLGGPATPLLRNLGDAHGLRAPFDFWWGPSIHWNTYLHRYVILLSRSNVGDFAFQGGIDNWYMTSSSLEDPTHWDEPAALPFPDGVKGGWYPEVVGAGPGETDKLAGQDARLFIQGTSRWQIHFQNSAVVAPAPNHPPVVANPLPDLTVGAGHAFSTTLPSTTFTDPDAQPLLWTVQGLPAWLGFDGSTQTLNGQAPGTLSDQVISLTVVATDPSGQSAQATFVLTVLAPPPPPPSLLARTSLELTVGEGLSDIAVGPGTSLTITGRAVDLDGRLVGHWLEIRNPQCAWSWQGWLSAEPWTYALGGNPFSSIKMGQYTFTDPGRYLIRTTTVNTLGNWQHSAEVKVSVGESHLPLVQIEVAGGANNQVVARGTILAITGRATDRQGDMKEHWLEIRNPAGSWSWEGWLTAAPWNGELAGSGFSSTKSASYAFDQLGDYLIRSTALAASGEWVVSSEIAVQVVGPSSAPSQ